MMIFPVLVLLCAVNADGAREGDFCTKDGVGGICTNIKKCPDAQEDIMNRKRPHLCEFGGKVPTACCISSISTTTLRVPASTTEYIPYEYGSIIPPENGENNCDPLQPSTTTKKIGQKAWDKCVEYQNRIVFPCISSEALPDVFSRSRRCHHSDELVSDVEAAAQNEFPHIALLGYGDDASNLLWLCTGSLISDKFVLTAAHCSSSRDGGDVTFALLGTLRLSYMHAGSKRQIKNIIKHPEYKPGLGYHDIALLELLEPVPLDEFTVPACIYMDEAEDDLQASIVGWSLTAFNRKPSNNLLKVGVTKFDVPECETTYKSTRRLPNGLQSTTQICYGNKEISRDACQGDSGGPLQIKNKKITCMYTILGVTSLATECSRGVPGIYTRVAHYLDWIEKIVWP